MKKYKIGSFKYDFFSILIIILTLIAFLIRVYQVDYLTLWVDEYVHTNTASAFLHEPAPDYNGIIYTWLIIPLFRLFGENEFWARFPSVVFGTLCVPLIYFFAKKYFNRSVGLFAAVIVTFSLYLVFWSRVARFYSVWTFFFLGFAYFLAQTLNVKNEWKPLSNKLFNYLQCTPKNLSITIILLLLSLISNQMTFMAVYSIGFYHWVVFIVRIFRKKYRFLSLNAWIAYGFMLFCAMTFIPAFQKVIKFFLFILFPEGIWNFLPQIDRLKELWATKPFDTFNIYLSVVKTDLPYLWIIGLIGLVLGFYRFRKSALFTFSFLAVLFLLLSFVYREPALPRYIIFIYPFFCIGIAVVFYEIIFQVNRFAKKPVVRNLFFGVVLIVLFLMTPWKQSLAMVKARSHGYVVPAELANWYFTDWKFPIRKVASHIQPDDVVLSTLVNSMQFYLHRPDIIQFRQLYYNPAVYGYQYSEIDTTTLNANSTAGFAHILNSCNRVWLFADYYFDTVLTDSTARSLAINQMKFEYDMSNEYVSVFSYDKAKPNTRPAPMFLYIHSKNPIAKECQFLKPENNDLLMSLDIEGVQFDNEVLIQLNNTNRVIGVLRQEGDLYKESGDSKSRQVFTIPIGRNELNEGIKSFRIGLNPNGMYKKCRFVVYNIQIQNKR